MPFSDGRSERKIIASQRQFQNKQEVNYLEKGLGCHVTKMTDDDDRSVGKEFRFAAFLLPRTTDRNLHDFHRHYSNYFHVSIGSRNFDRV